MTELSVERARQLRPNAERKDLTDEKIGGHAALFFEVSLTLSDGREFCWQQWIFSVDNRCFLAVAVMPEHAKEQIGGEIRTMLKSLQTEKAAAGKAGN